MTGASRVSEAELHAFVDGQLSDERALAVAVWLAENPRDGLRVDGWRTQNDAIQRAFPTPARERVTLAFRAPESDAPLTMPNPPAIDVYRARRRRRQTLSLALAFTIGALLAGAMALGLRRMAAPSASPEPIFADLATASDEFARRAVEAWRTYARDPIHPVEIPASDMATLTGWLRERTGLVRPPVIPDARLVGGRVLPAHGENAAFLLYRLASGDLVGLLVEAGARAPGAYSADGLSARAWSRGGFVYALAGGVTARELDSIASDLERAR
ncbi:MAG TPA: anti-sigma factor [Rhodoblastus sp.]|nr:anti-sigma factor [Rhodoblastus sp.]